MKIEKGVMIMKNNKGWGRTRNGTGDEAWLDPEEARIWNSEEIKRPTDATWAGGPFISELKDAKIVHVERITEVKII